MKPTILIVEDNQLSLSLLTTIFSSLGFNVKEIERGDEALPFLAANKVDIIVLDLELPGMSGDQIFAGLKNDPDLSSIPVVPFTAHQSTESEDSLSRKLIRVSVMKTGNVPSIVFKRVDPDQKNNITDEIVDEVARNLLLADRPLPQETYDHYKLFRGIEPEKLKSVLIETSRQNKPPE